MQRTLFINLIWLIASNETGAKSSHDVLLAHTGKNLQNKKHLKWKIHLPGNPVAGPVYSGHKWGRATIDDFKEPMFFILEQDIEEQSNSEERVPQNITTHAMKAEKTQNEQIDWYKTGTDEDHHYEFQGNIHARPQRQGE